MSNYELWYCDDFGNRLQQIEDAITFNYVLVVGDVGYISLEFPRRGQVYDQIRPDHRIHVYRQSPGSVLDLEMMFFLRRFQIVTDENGHEIMKVSGHDLNGLLTRRVNAYRADSTLSNNTTIYAAIAMRNACRFNVTINANIADYDGNAISGRGRSMHEAGLLVGDAGGLTNVGPQIDISITWQNLLSALQEIQATSKAQTPEVFFWFIPYTDKSFEITFDTGQPGDDRTTSGASPIIASLDNGNLVNPSLDQDFNQEANVIYAGGQGSDAELEDLRVIAESTDAAREFRSAVGRVEKFYNASRFSTSAGVQDAADGELKRWRPKTIFNGAITPTEDIPYGGFGWHNGDRITVDYAGYQFDALVRAINVTVSKDGRETITGRLEGVDIGIQ